MPWKCVSGSKSTLEKGGVVDPIYINIYIYILTIIQALNDD